MKRNFDKMNVSTYPHIPGNSQREGDPIADRYGAKMYLYVKNYISVVCGTPEERISFRRTRALAKFPF
jgi:hypothetical protein